MTIMNELTQEERDLVINMIYNVPLSGTYEQIQSLLTMVTNILTKLGGLNYDNSK